MKRGYDQPDDDNNLKDVTNLPTGGEQSTSTATINTVHVSSIQKKDLVKLNYSFIKILVNVCHIIAVVGLLALSLDMLVILSFSNHLDNISVSLPGRNMKSSSAVSIFQLSIGT